MADRNVTFDLSASPETVAGAESKLVNGYQVPNRQELLRPFTRAEWDDARAKLNVQNPDTNSDGYREAALRDALQLGRSLRTALQNRDGAAVRNVIDETWGRESTMNMAFNTLTGPQLMALVDHVRGTKYLPVLAAQVAMQPHPAPFQPGDVSELRRAIPENRPDILKAFNSLYVL